MCKKIKNKKCISEVPPTTSSFNVYNIAKYMRFALKAVCIINNCYQNGLILKVFLLKMLQSKLLGNKNY